MRPRLAILVPLLAGASLAGACSDSSGPHSENLEGEYPLFQVGASLLPVFDRFAGFSTRDSLIITGGTLRVLPRERVSIVTNVEWRGPQGIGVVTPETLIVAYTRIGDALVVPFPNAIGGAYSDTIVVFTDLLQMSRLRAHREGKSERRHFLYQRP
ncbi:MAG TPA: hypothetical protein VK922_17125 [Gemmatimonadaceae bacterium]|nr:hypothetical protein [Gemmatimonadaceae bacterium]